MARRGSRWVRARPRSGSRARRSLLLPAEFCETTLDATPQRQVSEIQQAGTTGFAPVGEGKWMGFSGGPFNGGKWLHEVDLDVN